MDNSDDDSSDSSNDFAGITSKDELTASFFSIKPTIKSNLVNSKDDSEDESSDNDNFTSIPDNNGIEIFSEVVKNLEASQRVLINDEEPEQHSSKYNISQDFKGVRTKKKNNNISDEINAVLLQGEAKADALCEDNEDTDDEDKKDEDIKRPDDYTIPQEGVNITVPSTSMIFKKKKGSSKESQLLAILRRKLKANQIIVEKVARLGWLAYGFYLNSQANEPEIMATVVSLTSTNNYPKDNFDLEYLRKFTKWFKNMFEIVSSDNEVIINKETLLNRIAEKKIFNYRELVILYTAIMRGIGLHCRLIVSLRPPLLKSYKDLSSKSSTANQNKIKEEVKETKSNVKSSKEDNKTDSKKDLENNSVKKRNSKKDLKSNNIIQNSENARRNANREAKKKAAEILRSKYRFDDEDDDKKKLNINVPTQDNASTSKNVKTVSTSSKEVDTSKSSKRLNFNKVYETSTTTKEKADTHISSKNNQPKMRNSKKQPRTSSIHSSSEEEEEEEPPSKAKRKCNNKNTVVKSKQKKKKENEASMDDEENDDKLKSRQDVWVEVYVESKGSWICVNVMDVNVDCVAEVYKKASKPVLYVIAYNSERLIKDVTRRYCPHWLSVTRKQRIDEKWWTETLSYWLEKETAMSKKEDELLLQKELEQPLPKTMSECKGHPLYVLSRHLHKYEALYPPDCVPLGYLKTGDAIYSRYCVYTLCSRETWLKKARVVKPNQQPYKIVKGLPKYDKLSGTRIQNPSLEIFGEWQTTEYVPPEAKNGVVPRNEYGNVDLFKKCMLPKGTVHLNLPGLNRIARKLNIDCATAVVGFNFSGAGAVPAIEGYVVCEEYEDTLRDAWETEQTEAIKRAKEKREKRIYGNWKKLIKGLLIKEKLSQKYEFHNESKTDKSNKRSKQRKTAVKKSKV